MSIVKLITFNNCLISTAQSRRFTATEDKYLNLGSAYNMMLLENFIEYLMDYMEEEKDNQTMVYISHNNSYFGYFTPKR